MLPVLGVAPLTPNSILVLETPSKIPGYTPLKILSVAHILNTSGN